ncbi:MAG: glycine zipper domain-containing protein [Gemmiger sp.]
MLSGHPAVGSGVASAVGTGVGAGVGSGVACAVGSGVGSAVGSTVGSAVGSSVGSVVGSMVGSVTGASVGSMVRGSSPSRRRMRELPGTALPSVWISPLRTVLTVLAAEVPGSRIAPSSSLVASSYTGR